MLPGFRIASLSFSTQPHTLSLNHQEKLRGKFKEFGDFVLIPSHAFHTNLMSSSNKSLYKGKFFNRARLSGSSCPKYGKLSRKSRSNRRKMFAFASVCRFNWFGHISLVLMTRCKECCFSSSSSLRFGHKFLGWLLIDWFPISVSLSFDESLIKYSRPAPKRMWVMPEGIFQFPFVIMSFPTAEWVSERDSSSKEERNRMRGRQIEKFRHRN